MRKRIVALVIAVACAFALLGFLTGCKDSTDPYRNLPPAVRDLQQRIDLMMEIDPTENIPRYKLNDAQVKFADLRTRYNNLSANDQDIAFREGVLAKLNELETLVIGFQRFSAWYLDIIELENDIIFNTDPTLEYEIRNVTISITQRTEIMRLRTFYTNNPAIADVEKVFAPLLKAKLDLWLEIADGRPAGQGIPTSLPTHRLASVTKNGVNYFATGAGRDEFHLFRMSMGDSIWVLDDQIIFNGVLLASLNPVSYTRNGNVFVLGNHLATGTLSISASGSSITVTNNLNNEIGTFAP
ncbi:MAG: hypothetical protein FWH03_04855 [Firmicutes bacterium]|nr:hypothetical protein [Bacillota bacterium]